MLLFLFEAVLYWLEKQLDCWMLLLAVHHWLLFLFEAVLYWFEKQVVHWMLLLAVHQLQS